jgi:hypothetical protein
MMISINAFTQDVEFTASSKGTVQVGEQFRLVYSVNQQADNFNGPDLSGFRVLSGPNQSTNQSYQFINGKVSQSFQVTFTYYLQATKEGSYTITPARVTTGGKNYESNSLAISVIQGSSPPSGAPGQSQRQPQGNQASFSKNDVFIRAVVDKSRVYQGEQAIVTYKIYTTVPVSQINVSKLSSFPGFWYKNLLNDNDPLKQYNEVIDGKEYVVADLRKIALYAQRSGEIRIEPMELECVAQVKVENTRSRDPFFDSFFNDPFFNRNYQNVPLALQSNAVSIDVRPLPAEGRPANFSGAVGNFSMSADIDRTELKTNDPITLKITLSGKGNIELIDALPITFPPDFETYDPKVTNNLTRNATGISGTRVFEYLVIPRNPGEFQIRPVEFSYFDPARQSYSVLSTPLYSISVQKGEHDGAAVAYSGVSQKNIQFIGSDIRHIKTGQIPLHPVNSMLIASYSFILWLAIPLAIFLAAYFYWLSDRKRRGNVALVRNRKANKVARKNLKRAGGFLAQNLATAFFEEISRALWGYISNKFNIPLSDLSIDTVHQRLTVKGVGEQQIQDFISVLERCEYARFAPGDKSGKMQEIYDDAMAVISRIEQELK